MRRMRRKALAVGTGMTMALLGACTDSATAPPGAKPTPTPMKPLFALGDTPAPTPLAFPGILVVCKTGDLSGSFTITRTAVGTSSGVVIGSQPRTIGPLTCLEVANDFTTLSGNGSNIVLTEAAPPPDVLATIVFCQMRGRDLQGNLQAAVPCDFTNGGTLFLNFYHGFTVVFNNTRTPPEICDFSTFGGFRLDDNFNISYGGNAGKIESGVAYGDLNYKNHSTGDHIHVQNVTDYGHPTTGPLSNFPDSRFAVGSGTINGEGSHLVEFRFVDIAEPGSDDLVWLRVDGVVLMDVQPVDGGNVQLHKNCKKTPTDEKH